VQDAAAQQVELGAAIHLPLQQFQAVHVSFGRAVAPRMRQRCTDRIDVARQALGEAAQARHLRLAQRRIKRVGIALAHEPGEGVGEFRREADVGRERSERPGEPLVSLVQRCFFCCQEARNVSTTLIQPGLEFRLGWSGRLCGVELSEAAGSLV